jgi:RNA polymerase sigma-B factor
VSKPAPVDHRMNRPSPAVHDHHVRLRRAEQVPTQVLALRWRERGDRWARDALIDRFQPLARRLARRYLTSAEPFDDLVQVASVGLVAAVNRFDPNRGIPFTAFAIPTILGELKRYFRDTGWSAHVPRGAQEAALRVEEASRQLTAHTGRAPNVGELAQYLELDTEQVLAGLEAGSAHFATSLDEPAAATDTEDHEPLHAYVGEVDDGYALVEMTASLAAAMSRLPYLERRALTLRLRHDLKQTEIADRLGCSQMQVSRLLRRATTRLREMIDPPADPAPSARSPMSSRASNASVSESHSSAMAL